MSENVENYLHDSAHKNIIRNKWVEFIQEIIVDDEEDIPVANALSESYTISSIPTGRDYKLIKKICNWEMYSDKYGNFMWKHSITGELLDRRPNELRKIVSISYDAR